MMKHFRRLLFPVVAIFALLPRATYAQPAILTESGTIATAGVNCSVATNCVRLSNPYLPQMSGATIDLTGTFSGATLEFEASLDGTEEHLIAWKVKPQTGGSDVSQATAVGQFLGPIASYRWIQVRAQGLSSGSVGVLIVANRDRAVISRTMDGGTGGGGGSGGDVNLTGLNGTAPGPSNPLFMQLSSGSGSQVFPTGDLDSGAGTVTRVLVGLAAPGAGGPVVIPGSATAGIKVDLGADNDVTVTGTVSGTGTAGSPSAGVMTIQGAGSMTPVLATLSGTNNINNISGTVSLPTGAATAAKQPALGTAGSASPDVITVQGATSMTPLNVALAAETSKNIGTVRLADSSGNGLTSNANSGARALGVVVYDGSGNAITAFSGSGGTASNFTSGFPSAGTAAGFSDGTNMQGARVVDADTGAGTFYTQAVNNVFRTSGTPVEAGTSSNPWNVVFPSAQGVTQSGTWNIGSITTLPAITFASAQAVTQSGTWNVGTVTTLTGITNPVTVDSELPAAATIATDAVTPTVPGAAAYNFIKTPGANTWDRLTSVANATNSTGAGILAAGLLAQFDDSSPTSITENSFGNVRMSANRNTYTTLRDAAGNERGANVNASSQLSVSVDNTVTVAAHAVTNAGTFAVQAAQSGTWTMQPGNTANTTAWLVAGGKTNNNAAPGATNFGVLPMLANAAAPSWTEGNIVLGSVDLHGSTRTTLLDSSGTAITTSCDQTQNTAISSCLTGPGLMGWASSATPTAAGGDGRGQFIWLDLNGRAHTASELAQGSTTSGQVGTLTQGAVTTSAPTYTSGQTSPLSLTTAGEIRVAVTSGSTGNAAASNTGSSVPTQAGYTGVNVGGTLRGLTAVNPSGSIYAAQVDLAAVGGATTAVNTGSADAGTQRVVLATNQPAVAVSATELTTISGAIRAEDAPSADAHTGIAALCTRKATAANTSGTDGDYEFLECSAGRLWTSATIDAALPAGTNVIGHMIADSGSTTAVTQATASNLNAQVVGTVASGSSDSGNPIKDGGVFNTTQPTVTTGQRVDAQYTARGAAIVAPGVDNFAVQATLAAETTKVIGTVNVAAAQTIAATSATASNFNAQVQGAAASGASKSGNPVQVGGVFNTTQPTVTNGQAVEAQATSRGAFIVAPGVDNFAVQATLAAETTKVIGTVNVPADPFGVNADAASATGSISAKLKFIASTGIPITGTVTVASHAVTNAGTFAVQDSEKIVDDAAFTVASTKLQPVGFVADEASIDSVNEDDLGAPRMTLDRIAYSTLAATTSSTQALVECAVVSAASTNATNCKASAGNFYGVDIVNTTTTTYYLRLYNLTTSPTCSSATGFIRSIPIPPASAAGGAGGIVRISPLPVNYGTGLAYCITGGASSTDNTNAAVGLYGTVLYK